MAVVKRLGAIYAPRSTTGFFSAILAWIGMGGPVPVGVVSGWPS